MNGFIASHLFGLFNNPLLLDFFLKASAGQRLEELEAASHCKVFSNCCSMPHLILLLLHFCQQEFGVDVALLQEMLQPLVTHVIGVPLPRLASLVRCVAGHMHKVNENTSTKDLK